MVGLLPDFGHPASTRSSKSWRISDWHFRSRVCRATWSKSHRSRHDGLIRQHFVDHARTKQRRQNPAYFVNLYEFFRPCYCVIPVCTEMDRYSRGTIQRARVARARHNGAFVWAVGGLEKRYETGIPAFKTCLAGLVWSAAYSECCPNHDDAAVGQ